MLAKRCVSGKNRGGGASLKQIGKDWPLRVKFLFLLLGFHVQS